MRSTLIVLILVCSAVRCYAQHHPQKRDRYSNLHTGQKIEIEEIGTGDDLLEIYHGVGRLTAAMLKHHPGDPRNQEWTYLLHFKDSSLHMDDTCVLYVIRKHITKNSKTLKTDDCYIIPLATFESQWAFIKSGDDKK
ncbi:MAG TPA: hypothetical protein VKS81_07630 [Bacteroidota bacterium]|nr:hypothetical protein [Bacteroidota bacterium]